MFKAILLICISNTTICLEAHDERGPYKTEQQCIERIYEMGLAIESRKDQPYTPKAYRCVQIGEQT